MKEAFFTYKEKVDSIREKLERASVILNRNHEKLLAFSDSMTHRITLLISFYTPEGSVDHLQKHIREECIKELGNILQNLSAPYNLPLSVSVDTLRLFREIITHTHFNNYTYNPDENKYYPKENINGYQRSEKDIEYLGHSEDLLNYCEIYLNTDSGKFALDEEKFKGFIEQNTFYVTNKKQKEIVKKVELISQTIEEISELANIDCSGYYGRMPNYARTYDILQNVT